jgi:16S rRNA processing protein RimM
MTGTELREVGKTGRPHGVRGDIYIDLITDREERLAVGARLQLGGRWYTVERAKRAGTRWLVHFTGIDDRTVAEGLVNQPLLAEPLPAAGDGLYVHDLIGALVVDTSGAELGTCTAVLANPAHDILDAEPGRVVVDPPEGLFDLA